MSHAMASLHDTLVYLPSIPVSECHIKAEPGFSSNVDTQLCNAATNIYVCYFPSRNVSGYMLFEPLWEAVARLERCGFKVILFSIPGVQSFLSRRICQDPLEKFFGCQRQIGRTHDNTTVKEFQQNTQALRVVNSFCRSSLKSNCRGNEDLATSEHYNYSLPDSYLSDVSDPCAIVLIGVKKILDDQSFYRTPELQKAMKTAGEFIKLATPPYSDQFIHFSETLVTTLKYSFTTKKSTQAEREHICTQFHEIRTSAAFHNAWSMFLLNLLRADPGPTFYQLGTQNIMTDLINQVYLSRKNPAISSSSSPIKIQELNNIEENALRYVASYICHKIVSNLSRSQHPHKLMLLLFMSDTNGHEMDPDNDTIVSSDGD